MVRFTKDLLVLHSFDVVDCASTSLCAFLLAGLDHLLGGVASVRMSQILGGLGLEFAHARLLLSWLRLLLHRLRFHHSARPLFSNY